MLELSEIVARISEGGIMHQIIFCFWAFVMIPLGLILIIISIKNANKQDLKIQKKEGQNAN
ncbi:MAG: hypothetical protein V1865_01260 [bacterium]